MRKLWASLVLAVLLISSFPVGLADEPAEPTRDVHSFECGIGQLTHEEVKTLYEEVYSKGYQSRVEVSPSPTHSLEQNVQEVLKRTPQQIIDDHNNRTDPNANKSVIGGNEIATPDGQRKYDYTRGCVSCEFFPFTSGTDTPYFACSKDLTTRVSYCEKGIGECAENVTNKTKVAALFGGLWGAGHDNLMAIDDFKFYERNGAFAPTDYQTLIYSSAQKIYDNWLPVATIISIFMPTPWGLVKGVKTKAGDLVTWFKSRVLQSAKSQQAAVARGGTALARRAAVKGSDIVATQKGIVRAMGRNADSALSAPGTGLLDDAYKMADEMVDGTVQLRKSASTAAERAGRHMELKDPLSPQAFSFGTFEEGFNKAVNRAIQKGSKESDSTARAIFEGFEMSTMANAAEANTQSVIAKLLANKRITEAQAKGLLTSLGVPPTSALDDALRAAGGAFDNLAAGPGNPAYDDAVNALIAQLSTSKTLAAAGKYDDVAKGIVSTYTRAHGDVIGVYQVAGAGASASAATASSIDEAAEIIARAISGEGGDVAAALKAAKAAAGGAPLTPALVTSMVTDAAEAAAKKSGDDAAKVVLKDLGLRSGSMQEIIKNPGNIADALADDAAHFITDGTKGVTKAKEMKQITQSQEGFFVRLGRLMTGRLKSTTGRLLVRGTVLYWTAHAPASNTVGAHQMIFTVSSAAKGKANIEEHLDGTPPYMDIYTRDSSYLEGFHWILSKIGIPDIVNRWFSLLQWRWSGTTDQKPQDLDIEPECRDDGSKVKDTVWTFRSGKYDETFVVGDGTLRMAISGDVLVLESEGRAHSYTTEIDEQEGCLPTIIVKTHGVDIESQVWKSKGVSIEALSDLMESLTGRKSGKVDVDSNGQGLRFQDYLSPPADEPRCAEFVLPGAEGFFSSAGFYLVAQSIPFLDIATMPFAAYYMADCIDTDYYVHMTVNQDQSGTELLTDLFSSGETGEALNATGGAPAGAPATPTGAAVAVEGEVAQRTIEGASPTGAAVSDSLVIGGDEEKEGGTTYAGSMEGVMNRFVEMGKGVKEYAERTIREQEVKRLNKKTFWFRGQYANGFYGALKVQNCCYIYFTGNSVQLPMDTEVKERAMVDNLAPGGKDKTVIKITKEPDGTPTLEVEKVKKDGKKRTVLKKTDDMLRQQVDQPKTGTIIPKKVSEIKIDPSSTDILFRSTLGGPSSTAQVRGGDIGSEKVKGILKCITDYVNGVLMKHYSELEFDRALAELGEINRIVLDSGVQIERKDDKFILANPGGINTGSNLEIRVDRTVLLNGVELGKAKIMHTERGQFMWLAEKNKLMIWLYKLGEGKASKLGVDTAATEDLIQGKDNNNNGVPDAKEYALGLNPDNPDSNNNGIPDVQEDNNNNGIPDGEEVICNFHGFMLDLGPDLAQYMNMIGPVLSFETSDHTVTFIADKDDNTGTCRKYVRMCNRATGVCEDPEVISNVQVAANTISITTAKNHLKLLEIGLDAEGKPTLKSIHKDEAGNIVQGEETFGPEGIEKLRGTKGVGVYDPETGQWTFYNGFDIPRDPRYKDGMTVAPTYNNSPTIMPGNMMGAPPKQDTKDAQSLLAELPWSPQGDGMFLFVAFLLMAALLIRKKNGP